MTRSRSLSLSVALHAAVVGSLVGLGTRYDGEPTPEAISVVWIDTGLPDLATASRGDAGIADTAESALDGEPLPELVAATTDDAPAPPHADARDPVSGADRPAAEPLDLGDEDRERASEGDTPDGGAPAETSEAPKESVAAGATPADTTREPTDKTPPPREPTELAEQPRERTLEPIAVAEERPTPLDEAPKSAEQQSTESAPEPVTADERERLREDVMDWINRAREIPSRASIAWSRDGHEYRAEVTRVLAAGPMGIEEALIEISTERDGRHISTEMRAKRLAFSHYAQFIDRWDPEVQIHDDEIDGRFHSNTEILIESTGSVQPVFHGKVTTTSGIDTSRSSRRVRRSEVFLGGLETRVPRIALPRRFAPLEAIAADAGEIVVVETDSRIVFFADGAYAVEAIDGGARRDGRLGAAPTYFIAAEKTAAAVKGTVNGKVLVYSPTEIVIEGDLVYAADPRRSESVDDYLGLVSDGTVAIADSEVTGPGDLTVHAAIYAKGRFAVRRYSRGDRATLSIYGSVTAGSLTATEPRYRTKLEFDTRLENARPPSFPMTDRYELASWDGMWRSAAE